MAINRADYFFYSCADNKEYFLARSIKENKLYPLFPLVDSKFFSAKSNTNKKKRKNYEYFLIASKLEKRKNIIEAILGYKKYIGNISIVSNDFPRLIIAGIGPEYNFLKKRKRIKTLFFTNYRR